MKSSVPWGNPAYGALMLTGMVIGAVYWFRASRSDGRLALVYAACLGGAFLGAKLAFLLAEGWLEWGNPERWRIWLSGKSITGALLGGWAGVELAKWGTGYRKDTGDRFALLLPIPLMLGRLGCLQAGCCEGVSCRWGKWPAVEVEMGFQGLALAVLLGMHWRGIQVGQRFHLYLMAYGGFRFGHEFLRATPKEIGGLSGYQWVALGMVVAGSIGYWRRANRRLPARAGLNDVLDKEGHEHGGDTADDVKTAKVAAVEVPDPMIDHRGADGSENVEDHG
ncbi:phosphatidylglycerol:prolipoprotein diacylglycerol transferase [Haloferula luteola]|uniref:Phosphatidylglycerol:prolipoprotein diacylglycerol transferase n=1 Tax=Haloferula luteola TaxID=595692 RepID=A0A840V894_9BACT|nr:prolipoprotein diacylglyceryl transferase family protein [Haloferula luteola]MBB5353276.1 phosphatidylglycerol:prolipoprotein diacylglycerol transferase [Haloferula luteola]